MTAKRSYWLLVSKKGVADSRWLEFFEDECEDDDEDEDFLIPYRNRPRPR